MPPALFFFLKSSLAIYSLLYFHMNFRIVFLFLWKMSLEDFPGGLMVKNLPVNAGDTGSIPGPGRPHRLWANRTLQLLSLGSRCSTRRKATTMRSLHHNKG